jgi:hypothetical protein
MHFTISKEKASANPEMTYVVGHSLGGGWTRHLVELDKGDTADNPASTKGPIYGPSFISYDISPSGITVHVEESCKEFYDSIFRGRIQQAYNLRETVKDALEGDSNDADHDALVACADFLGIEYDPDRG